MNNSTISHAGFSSSESDELLASKKQTSDAGGASINSLVKVSLVGNSRNDKTEFQVPPDAALDTIASEAKRTAFDPSGLSTILDGDFGRYEIERVLGEGAMGAVYLARDSQLNRAVALKTPKFAAATDPKAIERFYREARSAATLRHPNICPRLRRRRYRRPSLHHDGVHP